MNWELIEYNVFDGKYNMEFDLELTNNCKPNTSYLRFYGWKPACISIGANQSFDDINIELAKKDNIDVVKRPTGGRAILHNEELTYSVIMPNIIDINGLEVYEKISLALVDGLKNYNSLLSNVSLESQQPNFSRVIKEIDGAICFGSIAKSEIKYLGKKLVGSAQRKIGNTILQHGSILVGPSHKNLVKYLNAYNDKKEILKKHITERTIELSTILGSKIEILDLQENIIKGFNNVFDVNIVPELSLINKV